MNLIAMMTANKKEFDLSRLEISFSFEKTQLKLNRQHLFVEAYEMTTTERVLGARDRWKIGTIAYPSNKILLEFIPYGMVQMRTFRVYKTTNTNFAKSTIKHLAQKIGYHICPHHINHTGLIKTAEKLCLDLHKYYLIDSVLAS